MTASRRERDNVAWLKGKRFFSKAEVNMESPLIIHILSGALCLLAVLLFWS
jgi:hypothetical protein